MRIELPEGYEPPQPTHPDYGYLTPQERAELESELEAEQAASGGEAGDGMPGAGDAAPVPERSPWSPPPPAAEPEPPPERDPLPDPEPDPAPDVEPDVEPDVAPAPDPTPELVSAHTPQPAEVTPAAETPAEKPAEETRPRAGGWVPTRPGPRAAAPEPSPEVSAGEPRWDAYRQQWVTDPQGDPGDPDGEEPVDVAAAAGGRGATSSWTSAEGRRYRWDARAQEWVVEEDGEPDRKPGG